MEVRMTESAHGNRLQLRDLDVMQPVAATTCDGVVKGVKVTLNFALELEDGELIDSNFDKPPVSFVVGDGNMLPGFELALIGRRSGDRVDAVIPAAQAFGPVNPDNQQRFPRYQFPPDLPLSENLLVEFADKSGYKQAGRVVRIGVHDIEIDFNHPLAGRSILFSAVIHRVEPVAAS
jgi:FKBP-type peptidyl-prolyl cis-trans isomerase SlpA